MSTLRILHVDDEPDIRELVEISLALDPDLSVKSCSSGSDALAAAVDWSPDLVLMDVMMPMMDGPQTLSHLLEHAKTVEIPVVFMTARAQARELAHFLSLCRSRRRGFFAEAALQRVHQTDDIAVLARPRRVDDALTTPLSVDQINEGGFIMVLKFFWFKGARLLFDNMSSEIEHVLCDFHILNVVEIFRRIADFVGIAQQQAD